MLQLDDGSRDRCGITSSKKFRSGTHRSGTHQPCISWVPYSESLERGGPGWLLKLRKMGTQRIQMKGVLPWSVRWALCALAALVGPVQYIFSPSSSKLGRQSCRVACLLMCFSDCTTPLSARAVWFNICCRMHHHVAALTTPIFVSFRTPWQHPFLHIRHLFGGYKS